MNKNMNHDKNFSDTVFYFFLIGSIISLISSSSTIIFYLMKKRLQILSFRIIVYAQCTNFLVSLTSCISFIIFDIFDVQQDEVSALCKVQGYFMNFFNLLAISIVSTISFVLYLTIFFPNLSIRTIKNICLFINLMLSATLSLM